MLLDRFILKIYWMNFFTSAIQSASRASLCNPLKYESFLILCPQRSKSISECQLFTVVSSFEARKRAGTLRLFTISVSSKSCTLKLPFSSKVPLTKKQPALMSNSGQSEYLFPISTTNLEKDLKQESKITAMTSFFTSLWFELLMSSQNFRAQAEPIDLPHSMNFLMLYLSFRDSKTASTSYFSLAPNEILLPSELPHPEKSKWQKKSPIFKISSIYATPKYTLIYFKAESRSYCADKAHRSANLKTRGCSDRNWPEFSAFGSLGR